MINECQICYSNNSRVIYKGLIRDGGFKSFSDGENNVYECLGCGVYRLDENACKKEDLYAGVEYRELLSEPTTSDGFIEFHDSSQIEKLNILWPDSVRNKVIGDIGCAGGSFLDHLSGIAKSIIAVEPCKVYHKHLESKGYEVFASVAEAIDSQKMRLDYAFCFSVIEHVLDPVTFIKELSDLVKPGGTIFLSTPNRNDILLSILGEHFQSFFYRTVHRWYFDIESFVFCANKAGVIVEESKCVHKFGLSNVMLWLKDMKPPGNASIPQLDDDQLNSWWKKYLENKKLGDYLYFKLRTMN